MKMIIIIKKWLVQDTWSVEYKIGDETFEPMYRSFKELYADLPKIAERILHGVKKK
jgi:hypothetical protein